MVLNFNQLILLGIGSIVAGGLASLLATVFMNYVHQQHQTSLISSALQGVQGANYVQTVDKAQEDNKGSANYVQTVDKAQENNKGSGGGQ